MPQLGRRVLVCGGRDFHNRTLLYRVLNASHKAKSIELIIQGGAAGADKLAKLWALDNNIPVLEFKADWAKYGKAAGAIRNQQMLDEGKPDIGIAFPGGKGTTDMHKRLRKAGVVCLKVNNDKTQ